MKSVQLNNIVFEIQSFGSAAFLLQPQESNEQIDLLPIGEQLFQHQLNGVYDVITSEKDIVIRFKEVDKAIVLAALRIFSSNQKTTTNQKYATKNSVYKFPIYFEEGLDWKFVENHLNQSKATIIQQLKKQSFKIAMFGFMPGFLYLNGLPKTLHCPRKSNPRPNLPAGSIAIGGPYLGCYSLSSPGGWQIIGQTPLKLFNKIQLPPVSLSVNDSLQIEPINKEQFIQLQKTSIDLKTYNAND